MSVTVDAKDLANAAAWAARAIPTRPNAPALAAARLAVTDGDLVVSGYDFDRSVSVTVGAEGAFTGTVYVHGHTFAKAIEKCSGVVTLTEDDKTARLIVTAARQRFALSVIPGHDYPTRPAPPAAVATSRGFADAFSRASLAASGDTANLALTAVRISATDGRFVLYATDRYRAHRVFGDWDGDDLADTCVPAAFKDVIGRLDTGGTVTIGCNPNRFSVDAGHVSTSTSLLDVAFPAVEKLINIPDEGSYVTVAVAELADAISSAIVTAEPKTPVTLTPGDGFLMADSSSHDANSQVEVGADVTGDPPSAGFAPSFLLQALKAITQPYVRIHTAPGGRRPAYMIGVTADGVADADTDIILMPVRKPS